jgi:hypothetical protein
MKKLFYLAIFSAFGILSKPSPATAFDYESTSMQIDSTDTVVFDLSQVVASGGLINFPLSINSDDTIYSLDFSLKYNDQSINYDSIIELTSYVQSFFFYNPNDSTLRYTSSALQPYDIATSLTLIQFDLFASQISDSDLYDVKAYLNGSECSIIIIPPPISGVTENHGYENSVIIYPNPATSALTISAKENAIVQMINVNGDIIMQQEISSGSSSLDISRISNGCYFVKVIREKSSTVKKFIKD